MRSAIVIHGRIERGNRTVIEQAAVFLTFVGLLVAVFVPTHVFFRIADMYPIYAVDDVLANLSVALSNLGIYGLPASPEQALGEDFVLRIGGFYNYGPFPFYAGAAIDWLFGTSYPLQRFLHPLCLFLSAVVAFFTFRRLNVGLAAVYIWLVLAIFWGVMWPMVRPDPFTALFSVIAIACFTAALVTDKRRFWFAGSFFAVTAVTTHLVVAAIVPWMLVVIATGLYLRWSANRTDIFFKRYVWQRLTLSAIGSLIALAIFLEAMDFRLNEFYTLATNVSQRDGGFDLAKFAAGCVAQFKWTWFHLTNGIKLVLALGIVCGVISLLVLPFFERRHVVTVVAFFGLPFTFLVFYSLSLGLYPNFHTGYSLVAQLTGTWAVIAGYGTLIWLFAEKRPLFGPLATFGTPVAGLILIMGQSISTLSGDAVWAKGDNVSFSRYYDQALENIPRKSLILAGAVFGLESGTRFAALQWSDALSSMKEMNEQERQDVSPDYMVLNDYLRFLTVFHLSGDAANTGVEPLLLEAFGDARYQQKKIVHAKPYGSAIIYEKQTAQDTEAAPPLVAAYDHANDVWNSNIKEIGVPVFSVTPPVSFDLSSFSVKANARLSKKTTLEAGTYLLEITPDQPGSGIFLATSSAAFQSSRGINLNFEMQETPYAPWDTTVYLLVSHNGGDLYVSEASNSPDTKPGYSVTRAWRTGEYTIEGRPLDVAPVSKWENAHKSTLAMQSDGWLLVDGGDSRYGHQIRSPIVQVPRDTDIRFSIDLEELVGVVSVGILNPAKGEWIYPPVTQGVHRFLFNTGDNNEVRAVIANLQHGDQQKTRFRLTSPRMVQDLTSLNRIFWFLGCEPDPATSGKVPVTPAEIRAAKYCHSIERPKGTR